MGDWPDKVFAYGKGKIVDVPIADFITGVSRLGVKRQEQSTQDMSVDIISKLGVTGVLAAMSAGT